MQPNVAATLRMALSDLESEKATMDRQIAAIRLLLDGQSSAKLPRLSVVPSSPKPKRRTMSAAARKAISRKMKAAWAKRKAAAKAKPVRKAEK